MKNRVNMRFALPVIFLAAAMLAACDDWTRPEGLKLQDPDISKQDPELYGKYLNSVREYKKTMHYVTMGWFDNSVKTPFSPSQFIDAVPDSVDIVSLLSPDDLTASEIEQMRAVQSLKATRVVYTIDCVAFQAAFDARKAQAAEDGVPFEEVYTEQLQDFIASQVALLGKYPYSGLSVHYNGYSAEALSTEQLEELTAQQDIIFGAIGSAKEENPDKTFIMEGMPQFVVDKQALEMFDYLVIRTHTLSSIGDVEHALQRAWVEGVPDDRFIVTVVPLTLDPNYPRGLMLDAQGEKTINAIMHIAEWTIIPAAYRKAGIGIYLINEDYYNAEYDYKHVRAAISIMNPSPKF